MPLKSFHKGKNVMLFATNKIVGLSRAFDLRLLIDAKNAYLVSMIGLMEPPMIGIMEPLSCIEFGR